ncbi:MAG: hypothetical protein EPO21_22325 [Chloroflexota bacterium]|nr:MAG: hypothetical protein EPO21_22325 [Chloroflexota bacterium]
MRGSLRPFLIALPLLLSLLILLVPEHATPVSADSKNVTFVDQIGGTVAAVAVNGNRAYVGMGARLVILDLTAPTAPAMLGQTGLLPRPIEGLTVSDRYAYVADGPAGLRVIDVSDPARPAEVGSYQTPGEALGVVVQGGRAYVSASTAGLQVLDVSDPAHPIYAGSYDTQGYAWDVALSGNYAFVTDGFEGLHVIDVSNASRPTLLSSLPVGYARAVAVSWGFAYVATMGSGLAVIDISNPAHPTQSGSLDALGYAWDVSISGTHAYVAAGTLGLRVVDVSNPTHPTVASFYDVPGNGVGIASAGNYAFLADGSAGLRIFDVSDTARPKELSSYGMPGEVQGLALSGSYAYMASRLSMGLRAVDISDPVRLMAASSGYRPAIGWSVAVSGSYAYMADGASGLRVMDISDPTQPTEVGSYVRGNARGVALAGQYAYVADGAQGLSIVDVSDPTCPALVGSFATPDEAVRVVISGAKAYVTDQDGILWTVDVSDPTHPRPIDRDDMPGRVGYAWDIAVSGSYAYVADDNPGLRVMDVSDPTNPTEVGSYVRGDARGVALADHYAYVADGAMGLSVVDISDPAHPAPAGSYDTPGEAVRVVVSGNYAFVADREQGLRIVDVSDPIRPNEVGSYGRDAHDVAVFGSYAFVAAGGGGLRIIDVSDPANPKESGSYSTQGEAWNVSAIDRYVFVTDGARNLSVVDVLEPDRPRLAGRYDLPEVAEHMVVSNGYVYLIGNQMGLVTLQFTPPPDVPPTVSANGPYLVELRGTVVLNATGSDADGDPVTFVWDLDNDGSFDVAGDRLLFLAKERKPGTSQTVVVQGCDRRRFCSTSSTTVTVAGPDLATTQFDVPSVVIAGQPVSITWTVQNQGTRIAQPTWIDRVYVSADANPSSDDVTLGNQGHRAALPTGDSYSGGSSQRLLNVAPGTYFVILSTDADGRLAEIETNTANNSAVRTMRVVAPDLTPTELISPPVGVIGQPITLTWSVQNQGDGEALPTWIDRVYLSTDSMYSDDDTLLGNQARSSAVPAGSGYSMTVAPRLQSTLATGNYYVIVRADADGRLAEASDDNNTALGVPIVLQMSNLVPTALSSTHITAQAGQFITVTWTVDNRGSGEARPTWMDRLYFSTDGAWSDDDTLAGARPHSMAVEPGQSYSETLRVRVPTLPAGDYALIIKVDADGRLPESDENDNMGKIPFTITP